MSQGQGSAIEAAPIAAPSEPVSTVPAPVAPIASPQGKVERDPFESFDSRIEESLTQASVAASPVVERQGAQSSSNESLGKIKVLISEKTGYPEDMLNDEMSLEEDLGIDSIKRVEIFSALQDSFSAIADADPEELSQLQSIGDIASYLGASQQARRRKQQSQRRSKQAR